MERINQWKLPFSAVRWYSSSAIVPKPPTFNFTQPLQPNSSIPFHNLTRSYGFYLSPHLRLRNRGNHNHFDRRSKRFSWPKMVFTGVALSGGLLYFVLLETGPYTHRNRILIVTDEFSREIGERGLQRHKQRNPEGYVFPATHPRSVKVCSILQKLLCTLHKDLGLNETPIVTCRGLAFPVAKPGQEVIRGRRTDIGHLKGKNWEVVVVDDPKRRAFSLGDGIIVLHTGLLDTLSDVELATVIAHEVAHGVARHDAEGLTLIYIMLFLETIQMTKFVNIDRLAVAYERRAEIEADYISLLLMASAGYDPHAVLQVYEKLEPYYRNRDHSSISKQERFQLLSRPHVVEEALAVYRLATGNK